MAWEAPHDASLGLAGLNHERELHKEGQVSTRKRVANVRGIN
jgi:hypothetical protein